jgi:hypothetical protein
MFAVEIFPIVVAVSTGSWQIGGRIFYHRLLPTIAFVFHIFYSWRKGTIVAVTTLVCNNVVWHVEYNS